MSNSGALPHDERGVRRPVRRAADRDRFAAAIRRKCGRSPLAGVSTAWGRVCRWMGQNWHTACSHHIDSVRNFPQDPCPAGEAGWVRGWSKPMLMVASFALALGCGPRPLPAGYAGHDVRRFVVEHRRELQRDMQVGSGEYLYQLGILGGCQNPAELERRLSKRYAVVFAPPGVSDAEVAERVLAVMSEAPELRCLDLELSPQRRFAAGRRHIYPWRRLWPLRPGR